MKLSTSQGFYPVEDDEFLRQGSDLTAQRIQLDLDVNA